MPRRAQQRFLHDGWDGIRRPAQTPCDATLVRPARGVCAEGTVGDDDFRAGVPVPPPLANPQAGHPTSSVPRAGPYGHGPGIDYPNRRGPSAKQIDDPVLSLIMEGLAAMPAAQRNARLMLLEYLNDMPKEQMALIAKAVQPHLTDGEVANLCGVSVRTLYRFKRYQSFKLRLADFWASARERWYMPAEPAK